ncbi:tetratricopeptide repeat protein, partial [Methyloversatilis sp. XJ19-49]|nr:tetratricopeptide repeat protein [Methyloversatilis sp. XJ19-49]
MSLRTITGLTVSGANPRSLELLELAEHQFRCFIGDPVATVSAALEDSPDMVMGHVLLAYLMLLGTEPAGLPVASAACRSAEKLPANAREAHHVKAVGLLVGGRVGAAARG